jgi:hypothetical protein
LLSQALRFLRFLASSFLLHQGLVHQPLHFIKPLRASAFGLCARPARHLPKPLAKAARSFHAASSSCGVFRHSPRGQVP